MAARFLLGRDVSERIAITRDRIARIVIVNRTTAAYSNENVRCLVLLISYFSLYRSSPVNIKLNEESIDLSRSKMRYRNI